MKTLNEKQLKLPIKTLKELGFYRKSYQDEEGREKTNYQIKGKVNDFVYYNPLEEKYVWYYKTVIGKGAIHVNLDITNIPQLLHVLQIFRIDFNF